MSALRGRVHELKGRKVVPTFHPAYLLRDPSKKKECWQDIRLAMAELGLSLGERGALDRAPNR
jgi:DNA polymerase